MDELVKQLTPAERFVAQRYLATLEARGAGSPVGGVGGGGGWRAAAVDGVGAAAALTAAGGGRGGSQRSLADAQLDRVLAETSRVDALDLERH